MFRTSQRRCAPLALTLAVFASILVPIAALPTASHGDEITGHARIVDGDTVDIDGFGIRLLHIDAPETAQHCQDARGRRYACGKEATAHLRRAIGPYQVRCRGDRRDRYDRLLATCHALRPDGPVDLNRLMVLSGWAERYDETAAYLDEALDAAKAARGIHSGGYVRPRDFRAERWEIALARAKAQRAPEGCPIKGNISSNGRIYHTPWSRWYDRTRINEAKGERWFCDEAEAIRAGWRAPYR